MTKAEVKRQLEKQIAANIKVGYRFVHSTWNNPFEVTFVSHRRIVFKSLGGSTNMVGACLPSEFSSYVKEADENNITQ